jgi:uncharacterized membrane protein
MLATVVWIGGLAALSLLVLPAANKSLDPQTYASLLQAIQRRLDPLGWLSLIVLVGTGMFQMSASPNYQGFLTFNNRWAIALLLKHVVFLVMVAVSAYLTWGILPRLQRAALRQAHGIDASEPTQWRQQEIKLLRFNLFLGAIVLALTALARAA